MLSHSPLLLLIRRSGGLADENGHQLLDSRGLRNAAATTEYEDEHMRLWRLVTSCAVSTSLQGTNDSWADQAWPLG